MTAEERYYLDANTVIAIVEGGQTLNAAQHSFLANVDAGRVFATSSEMALSECLVKPPATWTRRRFPRSSNF